MRALSQQTHRFLTRSNSHGQPLGVKTTQMYPVLRLRPLSLILHIRDMLNEHRTITKNLPPLRCLYLFTRKHVIYQFTIAFNKCVASIFELALGINPTAKRNILVVAML